MRSAGPGQSGFVAGAAGHQRAARALLVLIGLAFSIAFVTGPANTFLFLYTERVLDLGPGTTAALVLAAASPGCSGCSPGAWPPTASGAAWPELSAQVGTAIAGMLTYSGSAMGAVTGYLLAVFAGSAYAPPSPPWPSSCSRPGSGAPRPAGRPRRLGAVAGLVAFGLLADTFGGFGGAAVTVTVLVAPMAALFVLLPETKDADLEDAERELPATLVSPPSRATRQAVLKRTGTPKGAQLPEHLQVPAPVAVGLVLHGDLLGRARRRTGDQRAGHRAVRPAPRRHGPAHALRGADHRAGAAPGPRLVVHPAADLRPRRRVHGQAIDLKPDTLARVGRALDFLLERRRSSRLVFVVHLWETGAGRLAALDGWDGRRLGAAALGLPALDRLRLGLVPCTRFDSDGAAIGGSTFEAALAAFNALTAHAALELAELTGDGRWRALGRAARRRDRRAALGRGRGPVVGRGGRLWRDSLQRAGADTGRGAAGPGDRRRRRAGLALTS